MFWYCSLVLFCLFCFLASVSAGQRSSIGVLFLSYSRSIRIDCTRPNTTNLLCLLLYPDIQPASVSRHTTCIVISIYTYTSYIYICTTNQPTESVCFFLPSFLSFDFFQKNVLHQPCESNRAIPLSASVVVPNALLPAPPLPPPPS